ncbi:hypothetical protein LOAG_08724 [Loa loa]|uniref:Uncharacterized protein n=1 Tax=Loa loa TaxID=7209 RepID=A0A1S0TTE5_LOALO|nr:hypothetical protein LOAG_08724 [Loa loa]EFO19768.1 hypothetical protein LOAG_08724 [Loa loa]
MCPLIRHSIDPLSTGLPILGQSVHPSVRPSTHPSVRPSILSSVRPSICPSVLPSTRPFVYPSVRLCVRQSVCPSMCPSICPTNPSIRQSICPSVCPSASTYPPICLTVRPSIHFSICLPVIHQCFHPPVRQSVHLSVRYFAYPSVNASI